MVAFIEPQSNKTVLTSDKACCGDLGRVSETFCSGIGF